MSQETTHTPDENDTLLGQVAVPAFFQKLAADCGVSPADAAESRRLLELGDLVGPAVALFMHKKATAEREAHMAAAKEAAEAAFRVAGRPAPARTAGPAEEFLNIPGVKEAAEALLAKTQGQTQGG